MDSEKYNRTINLLCPTCGCTQFEFDTGVDETIETAKCASCGRAMTKDELIRENSENITEHIESIGKEVTRDFTHEMRKTLKQAFRGSKFIKTK